MLTGPVFILETVDFLSTYMIREAVRTLEVQNRLYTLSEYYYELCSTATKDYKENMILNPKLWCFQNYTDDVINHEVMELSSWKALKHSYFNNITKKLRNPIEFCLNVSVIRVPSDYAGYPIDVMSNEEINVQNQKENKNAGEGTSQGFQIAVDNDGLDIDLNSSPKNI